MSRAAQDDAILLPRLRALLAARLGLQFDPHQDDWLMTVLARLSGEQRPDQFLDQMEQRPTRAGLDALAAELTVGETFFFRHPEQFDALRTDVLPAWIRRSPPPRRLRALSAACASGEEAYTLAIAMQRAGLTLQGVDWDITAFDLNPAAVAKAVAARYGAWSLRATPASMRDAWFQREGDLHVPIATIRSRVRFEVRNIALPDASFWSPGAFDIIFCRNMLMYLEPATLQAAIRHLATALAPGGTLFLGHADTLRGYTDQLVLRQAHGCFFYQRADEAAPITPAWPFPFPGPDAADRARTPAAGSPPPPALPTAAPDETALLNEAMLLIEAGQIDDGLRACARLMTPEAPAALQAEVFFIQALAMEERGELPAAEWNHQRAAAKDAGFAMPHLRMGLMARRRGELVAARRELRHALALLDGESAERMRRFAGGFERDALRHLCRAEIGETAP
ncbi:MAG: CheR family methyltransferase [Burkholderiaceae bacterium]